MSEENAVQSSVEHSTKPAGERNLLAPDIQMVILTWVTFFLLWTVLYRYAWKPILDGLKRREDDIRSSVDEAKRIKEELAKINAVRQEMLNEADAKSKELIAKSRTEALELAKITHDKAKKEAQLLFENAQREIKEEVERARGKLKEESVQIAVGLAGKLLEQNFSDEKNKKLIKEFIEKI